MDLKERLIPLCKRGLLVFPARRIINEARGGEEDWDWRQIGSVQCPLHTPSEQSFL